MLATLNKEPFENPLIHRSGGLYQNHRDRFQWPRRHNDKLKPRRRGSTPSVSSCTCLSFHSQRATNYTRDGIPRKPRMVPPNVFNNSLHDASHCQGRRMAIRCKQMNGIRP